MIREYLFSGHFYFQHFFMILPANKISTLIFPAFFSVILFFSCSSSTEKQDEGIKEQNEFLIESDVAEEKEKLLTQIDQQINYINQTMNNLTDSLGEVSADQLSDIRDILEDNANKLQDYRDKLEDAEMEEWDEMLKEANILTRNINAEIDEIEGLSKPKI